MAGDYDHLKSRLKPAIFDYIEDLRKIAEKYELEPPREQIYFMQETLPSGAMPSGVFIHVSSDTYKILPRLHKNRELKRKHFDNLAEWLATSDQGFPIPHLSDEDRENSEERKKAYLGIIGNFAESVTDYQYGLVYAQTDRPAYQRISPLAGFDPSDEAFDRAFEVEINREYEEPRIWEVVVVLHSFHTDDDGLTISYPKKEWKERELKAKLKTPISITELESGEKAGITTYISERNTRFSRDDYPTTYGHKHKLAFELSVEDRSQEHTHGSKAEFVAMKAAEEIAENVLTGLRLFKPGGSGFLNSIYLLTDNWHSETLGVTEIDQSRLLSYRRSPSAIGGMNISRYESDIFEKFWDTYQEQICDEDHLISKGLHRFNQAYDESNRKNQIVDFFIGFESTLLKDINSLYSLKFPIRLMLLLRDSSYYTNEYLDEAADNLRKMRNSVIHSDNKIESELESIKDSGDLEYMIHSGDDISAYDFQSQIRQLFAATLTRYMELTEKYGTDISGINKQGLRPATDEMLMNPVEFENHL
jgi:hypothetical protein